MLTPTKDLDQAINQGYIIRRPGAHGWVLREFYQYCVYADKPFVEVRLGASNRTRHCYVGADLYECPYRLGEHAQRRCRQMFALHGCTDKNMHMIVSRTDACHYRVPVEMADDVAKALVDILSIKMFHEPNNVSQDELIESLDKWLESGYADA